MAENVLWERDLPRNTGYAFDLKQGQSIRIRSQTIIDFVCFNRANLRERFDQARTKANQRKVFLTTGDLLVSKLNNAMMTITEDTFKEGHHDLQEVAGVGERIRLVHQDRVHVVGEHVPDGPGDHVRLAVDLDRGRHLLDPPDHHLPEPQQVRQVVLQFPLVAVERAGERLFVCLD